MALSILVRMDKGPNLSLAGPPGLLYSCETWTLTGELRRRLNSFGTMSLRRIFGYRWHDYMSNDLVLREAGLKEVTCIVRELQLRLYGHVARLPGKDAAHRILSCQDSRGWTMPRGRSHASWLCQMESYLKDTSMAGLAFACAIARRRPKEYRCKVDAATRCSGVCPHTRPGLQDR